MATRPKRHRIRTSDTAWATCGPQCHSRTECSNDRARGARRLLQPLGPARRLGDGDRRFASRLLSNLMPPGRRSHGFTAPFRCAEPKWGGRPIAAGLAVRDSVLASERRKNMSASIVCGVDGSAYSQAALEVAGRLSERLGLKLLVAHVAEPAYIPYAASVPFGGMAGGYALHGGSGVSGGCGRAFARADRRRFRSRRGTSRAGRGASGSSRRPRRRRRR